MPVNRSKAADPRFWARWRQAGAVGRIRDEKIISIPKMIVVPGEPFNIMQSQISVGLFRQFMRESDYRIKGHNAKEVRDFLKTESEDRAMWYFNDKDTEEFFRWFNKKTGREGTDQQFRLPTYWEWKAAYEKVKDQLTGNAFWERTSTIDDGTVVIESLTGITLPDRCLPVVNARRAGVAIRPVVNKPKFFA